MSVSINFVTSTANVADSILIDLRPMPIGYGVELTYIAHIDQSHILFGSRFRLVSTSYYTQFLYSVLPRIMLLMYASSFS